MVQINSEFNIGDIVWFFDSSICKYREGKITEPISWNKWDGWNFEIEHYNENDEQTFYNIESSKLYKSTENLISDLFIHNKSPK